MYVYKFIYNIIYNIYYVLPDALIISGLAIIFKIIKILEESKECAESLYLALSSVLYYK